jgi:VanZ family protein
MTTWLWRWGPALVMMILIFTASGTPGNDLPQFGVWDFLVKKGGHMIGYALLGAAFLRGLANKKSINKGTLILAIILSALYAASDEFHQSFTPGRTPSVSDVGIDTFGATLGALAWTWVKSSLIFRRLLQ